jgi:methylated-DNA-protein-cysteine methyltransferase related protein
MAKSPFFTRIKTDVLQIIAAIPEARLCTFSQIGHHLDVMPRHIAYILTILEDEKKMTLPWYRVIAGDGSLGKPKFAPDGTSQSELLADEGIIINAKHGIAIDTYLIEIEALECGVAKQVRPADAPVR